MSLQWRCPGGVRVVCNGVSLTTSTVSRRSRRGVASVTQRNRNADEASVTGPGQHVPRRRAESSIRESADVPEVEHGLGCRSHTSFNAVIPCPN